MSTNAPDSHEAAARRSTVLHLRVPPGTSEPQYRAVLDLLEPLTPVVQVIPPGAALAEVSGVLRLHGRTPYELAEIIRLRALALTGVDVHLGVAANWALAATASAHPAGNSIRLVADDPAAVADFLHPLPVDALYGIGRRPAQTLHGYGVHYIGTLAALPLATVQRVLGGREGRLLHQRARGLDNRRVTPTALPRSTGESRHFDRDVLDGDVIRTAILDAVVVIGARLRERDQAASALQLQVRFADRSLLTRSRKLPAATAHDADLRECAYRIFNGLNLERARVRAVTVRAEQLLDADQVAEQISLDPTEENARRVETAVDRANRRFGRGTVRPAALAGRRTA
ncbi:DinB/UmuC family translesion DNA polymerase [Streptomyces sp. IBSBF 2950]|uniref:DinB/UmuC family translesion DNA polymerase n=1 Tax=Streptomyces sp. IBSBF 2950 TaxID=2903528 RepID=UPI002FDBAB48